MRVVGILMVQYGANVLFVNLFSGLQTRSLWCSLHLDARVARFSHPPKLHTLLGMVCRFLRQIQAFAPRRNVKRVFCRKHIEIAHNRTTKYQNAMFVTNVDESHADNLNIMCTHHIARNIPPLATYPLLSSSPPSPSSPPK